MRDPKNLPTLEGPKMYKRDGWYYIFAPYGGVPVGTQAVLRSKNIYGPYEYRTVLAQGNTNVNGPHQGGYVETPDGTGWFVHFHSQGAHGRIVYLEPVRWDAGWPVIGKAPPGATTGEPVREYRVPVVLHPQPSDRPQTSDDFSGRTLLPMWEWNHNPVDNLWSLTERPGFLRLHTSYSPDLLHARNTLTECLQDESAEVTVRLDLSHLVPGDRTGLSILDKSTAYVAVVQEKTGRKLVYSTGGPEIAGPAITAGSVQFRGIVHGDSASYSYSVDDGKTFERVDGEVKLAFGWWKGARPAVFAFNGDSASNAKGYADVDWVHYRPLPEHQ
jgi:beta-xylosidase